jgi:hypothetical protein
VTAEKTKKPGATAQNTAQVRTVHTHRVRTVPGAEPARKAPQLTGWLQNSMKGWRAGKKPEARTSACALRTLMVPRNDEELVILADQSQHRCGLRTVVIMRVGLRCQRAPSHQQRWRLSSLSKFHNLPKARPTPFARAGGDDSTAVSHYRSSMAQRPCELAHVLLLGHTTVVV